MANEKRTHKETTKRLRIRAEKRLASTRRDVAEMPLDDVQKLVHELQVHQIELEMQNDELRRTQLELEAARERLLLPYDAAPVGFLTLDAAGVIREDNLAAARLLNFDRVKLTGQKLTRFIAPESQDEFYLRRRQLFNTGEKQTCELHLLPVDRPRLIARVEAVLERTDPGGLPRCLAILSDITALKQAEAALREREQQLRLFVDHAPAAIAMLDAHMRYLAASQRWLADFGLSGRDLLGCSHYELFPELPERWKEIHRRCLAGAVERADEDQFTRADGSVQWLRWEVQPWKLASGAIGGIIIFSEDITARKQAVEALQASNEELTRFNRAAVGRELRMVELKREINALSAAAGQPPPFDLKFAAEEIRMV